MNAPLNTVLSREDYFVHLVDLVRALTQVHGELSLGAMTELANQEIITRGIIGAADRIRGTASMSMIDRNGFIICGGHRASLGKLLRDGPLANLQCSDVMLQNYLDLSRLDPPLVDVAGDTFAITDAGRKAMSGFQAGESPLERERRRAGRLQ